MYRHGFSSRPLVSVPSLARYYVACKGTLHPLYVNCATLPDVCGVLEALSECRSPELLHPESAAGPAASGSAAAPAIPGLLPLPLLGSEFLAFFAEYLSVIVEWALLASLLLPSPQSA